MNPSEYIEAVLKTESNDIQAIEGRLRSIGVNAAGVAVIQPYRLLHAAMGMATEAAEFQDMLKKHIFYGKPFDDINALEELGDMLWYIAVAIDSMGSSFERVMQTNIDKLLKRYKEGTFKEEDAIVRDLAAERTTLEKLSIIENAARVVKRSVERSEAMRATFLANYSGESVVAGETLEKRKIKALEELDRWNDVTGFIPKGCSYEGEIESLIEEAVEIGMFGEKRSHFSWENELESDE